MLNETILAFMRGSNTVSCSLVHSMGGMRYRTRGGWVDEPDGGVDVDILWKLSTKLRPLADELLLLLCSCSAVANGAKLPNLVWHHRIIGRRKALALPGSNASTKNDAILCPSFLGPLACFG